MLSLAMLYLLLAVWDFSTASFLMMHDAFIFTFIYIFIFIIFYIFYFYLYFLIMQVSWWCMMFLFQCTYLTQVPRSPRLVLDFGRLEDDVVQEVRKSLDELKRAKLDNPGPPLPEELPQVPFGEPVEPLLVKWGNSSG